MSGAGRAVVGVVLVAALAPVSWNAWQAHRARRAARSEADRLVALALAADSAGPRALLALERAKGLAPDDESIAVALTAARARFVADDPEALTPEGASALDLELALRPDAGRPVDRALASGRIARQRNDAAEAERAFAQAVQIAPEDARALLALGLVQWETGRSVEAVETLRRAVERDPQGWRARRALGLALLAAGQWAGAEEALAVVAEQRPDVMLLTGLGEARLRLEKLEPAAQALERAIAVSPDEVARAPLRQKLGFVKYRLGRPLEAARELRLAARQGGNAALQHNLGVALQAAGDLQAAAAAFEAALAEDPGNGDAWVRLVAVLTGLGRRETAAQVLERLRSAATSDLTLAPAVPQAELALSGPK